MKKTYVLDTSVLIHHPHSFKSFNNSSVIIPIDVIDELDKCKTRPDEAGKNARICIRLLDEICSKGNISKGIKIDNNILLKIDSSSYTNTFGSNDYKDNKILTCVYQVNKKNAKSKTNKVILVSRDFNLRIRAAGLGIDAQGYESTGLDTTTDLYTGYREILSDKIGQDILKKESLNPNSYPELKDLLPNECVHIMSDKGDGLDIARRTGDKVVSIKNKTPWGLSMRSKEQAFAAELMCDMKVPLVTLVGKAGTGKTLVALACALELVLERKRYSKLIIYRPIQPVGKDIGFIPGTIEEKLSPWMQPIMDNLEFLLSHQKGDGWEAMLEMYKKKKVIEMNALTYIRGRSIPNAIILLEEAQNISPHEMKTILTRIGENSKLIVNGDIAQTDVSTLDAMNNGLTYIIEKFKNSELAGHVTFTKGERSPLATLASEIL